MNPRLRAALDRLFVILQHLVPQHLLSRLVGRLAACRYAPIRNLLIERFIAAFAVDMREAANPDPRSYESFNTFFTRELAAGARVLDGAADSVLSPADGSVSEIGRITTGRVLQAKGRWYSTAELLADPDDAKLFGDGAFATIYLSPRDYHRVHMPVDATLRRLRYVPGSLFSVNRVTADGVPNLFARNERLVCLFDTAHGPMAMVLVGAMIVAGIESVWTGPVSPAGKRPLTIDAEMDPARRRIERGAEMGRFLLGSTVILLFPRGALEWDATLAAGSAVRMGQRIGRIA